MTDTRTLRTDALTAAAKARSEAKTQAAEKAIRALVKKGEPITFQAVGREAGVSHAFLYNHPDLRGRIEHLRAQARPAPAPRPAPSEHDTVVLALTAQIERMKKQHPWSKPTERTSTYAANSTAGATPPRHNQHA
jgi:predicted Zn-dependent protease